MRNSEWPGFWAPSYVLPWIRRYLVRKWWVYCLNIVTLYYHSRGRIKKYTNLTVSHRLSRWIKFLLSRAISFLLFSLFQITNFGHFKDERQRERTRCKVDTRILVFRLSRNFTEVASVSIVAQLVGKVKFRSHQSYKIVCFNFSDEPANISF